MSKNIYNEYQIKELEKNPNVLSASERSISYSPGFKLKAVKDYKNGKTPSQIFIEQGFDLEMIGKEQPKRCLQRWRGTFERYGEEGFLTERRGKGSTGRPSSKQLSIEEKLRKAEARIKFLEAENDFLKKLEELERQALKKKRF
ncbi:transposase [Cytobacillus firmus]|nr:transposase [Cytobacillus firmus]